MLSTYIKLLLTAVCWGGTFIAGKNLAQHVGPLTGAFLRFLVACVFLTVLTLRLEKKLVLPGRNNLLRLFLMGMTGIFLYNYFFLKGLKLIEAGRASIIAELSPLTAVTYSSLVGTAGLFPAAVMEGLFSSGGIGFAAWANAAYLGFFGTVLGFVWYYQGIQRIGPVRAGIFINFVPLSAVLLAFALLDEPITISLLAGAVLVSAGVYLTTLGSRPASGSCASGGGRCRAS